MPEQISIGDIIGVWIAAGLTLIIYSFLYKDNPLFRFGEHLYVGLATGYMLCYTWFEILWPDLIKPLYRRVTSSFGKILEEQLQVYESYWLIIPLVFSILMLTRFFPKISWLSRWSFAFIMGAVSGMAIPNVVSASIFKQLVPTLQPLYQPAQTLWHTILETSGIILILVGVIAVLVYFFFSVEHKGAIKTIARIGILYMMVAFGAAFGYTVMARETLAIGRFQYLIEWGKPSYYYASIVIFILIVALLWLWEILSIKVKQSPSESQERSK